MKLTTAQKALLRSLDGEKVRVIYATQARTAKVLKRLGLVEYVPVGHCFMGYRLTHRGLGVMLDLIF